MNERMDERTLLGSTIGSLASGLCDERKKERTRCESSEQRRNGTARREGKRRNELEKSLVASEIAIPI